MFKEVVLAHRVFHDNFVSVIVEAFVMHPVARQRAKSTSISTDDSLVFPALFSWVLPGWSIGHFKSDIP